MITKLELKRQLVHILLGIIIVVLLYYNIINALILFLCLIFFFIISFLQKKKYKIIFFSYLLEKLERKYEKKKIRAEGFIFYLLGSSLAVFLFQKNIALASITILALGDSISRLIGPFGYVKHPFNNKKFLEGAIVGAIISAMVAMLFVPLILALPASIVSMLIESTDIKIKKIKLDDNLLIPLVAGAVMFLINQLI